MSSAWPPPVAIAKSEMRTSCVRSTEACRLEQALTDCEAGYIHLPMQNAELNAMQP
jgi:hypothetical protein